MKQQSCVFNFIKYNDTWDSNMMVLLLFDHNFYFEQSIHFT